jgi:predicted AAA+ superfamily ATPase
MAKLSAELPRHLARTLDEGLSTFRVVVLTGVRQAGKSTLAQAACRSRGGVYRTLDDPGTLDAMRSDPAGAILGPAPVTIDEVQRAGDGLVRAIKANVDASPRPGAFLLTGSTRFLTVPTLSESLAGRAEILELWPFSQGELRRVRDAFAERLFAGEDAVRAIRCEPLSRADAAEVVCRGGYPEAQGLSPRLRGRWFAAYVRTVTERDVREIARLREVSELPRLLRLLAARTACEVNLAEVSRELGMPRETLLGYVAALTTLHLRYEIPAWSRNATSRIVKHPKGHLTDVGLAAWLLGVGPETLADPASPALGPLLESFVAGELARQRTWSQVDHSMHHYRDRSGPEVDLVLESRDGRVAAVEVKAAVSVLERDFAALRLLRDRLGKDFAHGVVLHLGREALPFGDRLTALPLSALWAPVPAPAAPSRARARRPARG